MNPIQTKWNLKVHHEAEEKKLPGFEKLLGSWLNVHRDFSEGGFPNFSWDYGWNERSQLGFLGNAAVLAGGLSSLEIWIEKHSSPNGRSDLWLRLNPPTSENDFLIEAKMEQYLNLTNLDECRSKIEISMKNACMDAKQLLKKPDGNKIVAMTFLSMRFEDKNLDLLEKNTDELISGIFKQNDIDKNLDAIAAIWMGENDFRTAKKERGGWEYLHFGMILLAKRINTPIT